LGGGVVGVEEGFDGGVELALRGEDEVDGVAAGAVASGVRGDVVGCGFGLDARVGGGDGQAARAHYRQIDDVVADVGEFVDGDIGTGEDVVYGGHFVGLALVDELEFEVLGADGDGGGLALGDEADAQAAETGESDSEAVVGGEALEFEAGVFAVGTRLAVVFREEEELAVGEDSIDVEDEDFDAAGAVFRGEGHAIDDNENAAGPGWRKSRAR